MPLVTTQDNQTFDMGDRPTLVAVFKNKAGQLDTPTGVTFSLMAPDGAVQSQDETFAVNSSTGVWEWQIPAPFDAPGTWKMHALATAGLQVAEEVAVKVRKSAFPYPPAP
jgi:hypothetical protein